MKIYQSHKKVTAAPMNRLDYNKYRGWELPSDENGEDDGYLVEYLDGGESNHPDHKGYISWSPKRQFDEGYNEVTSGLMNFGQAVEAMEHGYKVARTGWNGADMFAYYVPAASYTAQTHQIRGRFKNDEVPYRAYFALKTAQEDVATWNPSTSDCLGKDWMMVE